MVRRGSTFVIGTNTFFRELLTQISSTTHCRVRRVAERTDSAPRILELDLIVFVAGADEAGLLSQVQRVNKENPSAQVVAIGNIDRSEVVWTLLRAGAEGYFLVEIAPKASLATLGGTVVPTMPKEAFTIEGKHSAGIDQAVAAEIPNLNADAERRKLSRREADILLYLIKGESNKLIARKFEITEATVKVHLRAIFRKIRVSNRTQAAMWAHSNHLALPPKAGPVGLARADA